MSIIESLKDCSDAILGIRDGIGADLKKVYIVTRTWSGGEVGEGNVVDSEMILVNTPHIVDLSLNFRALEGGNVKQGDLLLKMVDKQRYPRETFEPTTLGKSQERFLRIGEQLYTVISIRERYLQFDIQVRPLSDQRRYLP
jgi:hypothetical protein